MAAEALAQGSQLLDLVGGHLAALEFVAEFIEADGGCARGVAVIKWEWWGHDASEKKILCQLN